MSEIVLNVSIPLDDEFFYVESAPIACKNLKFKCHLKI